MRPHLWLAPRSRRLLSAAWKDPPRSPQSWRASAPCPELPRGPPRPAAPRAPPPLSGLASPAAGRGESAAGWERGIQSVPLPPISRPPSFLGGGRSPPGLGPQTPSWLRRGYSPRARSSSPSGRAAAAASAPHPTPLFPRLTPPLHPARSAPAHKSFMSRLRGPPGWLPERRPRSPARLPDRPWDRAGLERRRPWRRAGEARGRGCRGTCCRPPTPLAPALTGGDLRMRPPGMRRFLKHTHPRREGRARGPGPRWGPAGGSARTRARLDPLSSFAYMPRGTPGDPASAISSGESGAPASTPFSQHPRLLKAG